MYFLKRLVSLIDLINTSFLLIYQLEIIKQIKFILTYSIRPAS